MGELTEVMNAADIEKEFSCWACGFWTGLIYVTLRSDSGMKCPQVIWLILEKLVGIQLLIEESSVYRLSLKGEDYGNRVFSEFI